MEQQNQDELNLLLRAVESEVFHFIVVRHNHLSLIGWVAESLKARYPNRPLRRMKLPLDKATSIGRELIGQNQGFLLIENFEYLLEDSDAALLLNQQRDKLGQYPVALVVFIPSGIETLRAMQKAMPDLWSVRNLEVELTKVPIAVEMEAFGISEVPPYSSLTAGEKEGEIIRLEKRFWELKNDGTAIKYRSELANRIGVLFDSLSQYTPALEWQNRALDLIREIGDKHGEALTLTNMSQAYSALGNYQIAHDYLEKSLMIFKGIGAKVDEGGVLNYLGRIYKAWGKNDLALECFNKSLKISLEAGDKSIESRALVDIGLIYKRQGDYDAAFAYFERSLEILQEMGDLASTGRLMGEIGQLYKDQGNLELSKMHLEKGLAILRSVGDRAGEGRTLSNLAGVFRAQGDYESALRHLNESLEIRREIGDRAGESATLNNISHIYSEKFEYQRALEYLEQSLKFVREVGDIGGLATVLYNLGGVYWAMEESKEAIEHLVGAHLLLKENNSFSHFRPEIRMKLVYDKIGPERFNSILDGLKDEGKIPSDFQVPFDAL